MVVPRPNRRAGSCSRSLRARSLHIPFARRTPGPISNPVSPRPPLFPGCEAPPHLPVLPAGYGSPVHLYVVVAPFSNSPSVHTHSLRHLAFVYTHVIPQCSSWSMLHAASPAVSPPSHHHIMFPRKVSALFQKKNHAATHDFLSPPNSNRATSLCLLRPRSPRPHHHVLDLHIIHISSRSLSSLSHPLSPTRIAFAR